jgi:hypothetical protein
MLENDNKIVEAYLLEKKKLVVCVEGIRIPKWGHHSTVSTNGLPRLGTATSSLRKYWQELPGGGIPPHHQL